MAELTHLADSGSLLAMLALFVSSSWAHVCVAAFAKGWCYSYKPASQVIRHYTAVLFSIACIECRLAMCAAELKLFSASSAARSARPAEHLVHFFCLLAWSTSHQSMIEDVQTPIRIIFHTTLSTIQASNLHAPDIVRGQDAVRSSPPLFRAAGRGQHVLSTGKIRP
jgi:hypothetical protein